MARNCASGTVQLGKRGVTGRYFVLEDALASRGSRESESALSRLPERLEAPGSSSARQASGERLTAEPRLGQRTGPLGASTR